MASTVLPNGIIIPEKYSRDWYNDLYHNWQELDNLLGVSPGDGTLTIQKNGSAVGTFSANQETDETINIEVPTKTSDLTNDSGFITGVAWDDVSNKPTFAAVATSGSYNDLSNKPTIPTVNNATLTIQKNGTTVNSFTANASSDVTCDIAVPTKTSDLTNDSGFITADNTKIPLSGTNALAGSIVPNTDNAYDFGSSTYKLRYVYANTAYVTNLNINGSPAGNILTHNANEFVNVTTNQTIGGVKTFSDIPIVASSKTYVSKIKANRTSGTTTGFSAYNGFKIVCDNDSQAWENTVFAMHVPEYSPTSATIAFKLYDCIEGSSSYKGFFFKKDGSGFQFSPTASNSTDLGSSTNKWKSFNGVSPSDLSLPNKSSYINIDTTNWDLTCSNQGVMANYVIEQSGWLELQIVHASADIVDLWVITGSIRTNNKSSLNTLDNRNFNMISLPVVKGDTLLIFGDASQYVAGRVINHARIYTGLGQA